VGTPISSILIGLSIVNHPFWGITLYGTPRWEYIGKLWDSKIAIEMA
jgi:hypothetical protein